MTDSTPAAPPIPTPEEIRPFYVRQLEILVEGGELEKADRALKARAEAARAEFALLFTSRGLRLEDFTVDLKTGKVSPVPPRTAPGEAAGAPQSPDLPAEG